MPVQGVNKKYDIIIVGGGLVGVTLAIALGASRRVALLESGVRPEPENKHPGGERAIVLSSASKNILTALGVWSSLASFVEPVNDVHVSDRGRFGQVTLSAQEENLPALGYVIQAKNLQAQLTDLLDQHASIDVYYQAQCDFLENNDAGASVGFHAMSGPDKISGELIVAADGYRSTVRERLGIAVNAVNYEQSAIVSNINLARGHRHIAYERFTATGPIALLPLSEKKATLVWTVPHSAVEAIQSLSADEFVARIQAIFGYRLGRFVAATPPSAFPITMQRAAELVRKRVVLVGNAANTLHPIAGQGLNLGLRDVAVLVELIHERGLDAMDQLLSDYVDRRRADHAQIVTITHSLVGFFTNAFLPLALARNVGMSVMDFLPPIKRWLSKRSLGEVGYTTSLACGVAVNYNEQ